jgi:hypothetical protein
MELADANAVQMPIRRSLTARTHEGVRLRTMAAARADRR